MQTERLRFGQRRHRRWQPLLRKENMLQQGSRSNGLGIEPSALANGLEVRLAQFQTHCLEHFLLGHDDGASFIARGYVADLRRLANSQYLCRERKQQLKRGADDQQRQRHNQEHYCPGGAGEQVLSAEELTTRVARGMPASIDPTVEAR